MRSPLPLSWAQGRLWLLAQLLPDSPAYNVPMAWRIRGPLDCAALSRALDVLVERHPMLRTCYAAVDGVPTQTVTDARFPGLPQPNLPDDVDAERRLQWARAAATQEVQRPFDLGRPPLLRGTVAQIAEDDWHLTLVTHHIAWDGWSQQTFLRELGEVYAAVRSGEAVHLPPPGRLYSDYVAEQHRSLASVEHEAAERYWSEVLAHGAPTLELPADRRRPRLQTLRGDTYRFPINKELVSRLTRLGLERNATLFTTLLAAFMVLLHRYSGEERISVAIPVADRDDEDFEGTVGLFLNTAPVIVDLCGRWSFADLVQQVRRTTLDAFEHRQTPFERMVQLAGAPRDTSRNPLAQVMFGLQSGAVDDIALAGTEAMRDTVVTTRSAKFDVEFAIRQRPEGMEGIVEYRDDLFGRARIARMADHYTNLLEEIAADVDRPVQSLRLLSTAESETLRVWSTPSGRSSADADASNPLEALLRHVRDHPDRVAIVERGRSYTYRQLGCHVRAVSHALAQRGVGAGEVVAIMAPRTTLYWAAVMGVLAAGAAFLPLDPALPVDRLQSMVRQAGVRRVVVDPDLEKSAHVARIRTSVGDVFGLRLDEDALDDPLSAVATPPLDAPAYVIFTSGSTGEPKGAIVNRRGFFNHTAAKVEDLRLNAEDRVAQNAQASFDISIWQLFAPLVAGGCAVIVPDGVAADPPALLGAIADGSVSIVELVPSVLHAALDVEDVSRRSADLSGVRTVILTGETASPALVRRLIERLPTAQVLNAYGPTEASDDITHGWLSLLDCAGTHAVPIGRAVRGAAVYVLDRGAHPPQLAPIGVPGHLAGGGIVVGGGYVAAPGLTAASFRPDVFSDEPGARLYMTGDLAAYRDDGRLDFFGRVDHQVKLRGYRIELEEVEAAALASTAAVKQACAVVARAGDADAIVLCLCAADTDTAQLQDRVATHLARVLPPYMVPSRTLVVPSMPLLSSGKLDRRAVAALATLDAAQALRSGDHDAPQKGLEARVAAAWTELISTASVGRHDNFFDVGGNSLLAARLAARLAVITGVDVSARLIFEHPTIATLASAISQLERRGAASPVRREPTVVAGAARRRATAVEHSTAERGESDGLHDQLGVVARIGRTPMARVALTVDGLPRTLYLKLEMRNPGGSIKDRAALGIVRELEQAGRLRPGAGLLESTSGNMGVALALLARTRGYRFRAIVDPKTPVESIGLMRALGAMVECVAQKDEAGGYLLTRLARVAEILREDPGWTWMDQYSSPGNPRAHEHATGPELLQQAGGRVSALFVAVSTGGTLRGLASCIRASRDPMRIVAVDAVGSVVFGGDPKPRLLTGIGSSRRPTFDLEGAYDDVVYVDDGEAFYWCRRFRGDAGICVGGSTGASLAAAIRYLSHHPETTAVACICPDGGDRYASTIFDDRWVAQAGGAVSTAADRVAGIRVVDEIPCGPTVPLLAR